MHLRRWRIDPREPRTHLEAYHIKGPSLVIDQRQEMLSRHRLSQQQTCHRADLLAIEYPLLPRAGAFPVQSIIKHRLYSVPVSFYGQSACVRTPLRVWGAAIVE
jgi:hypothetical protein